MAQLSCDHFLDEMFRALSPTYEPIVFGLYSNFLRLSVIITIIKATSEVRDGDGDVWRDWLAGDSGRGRSGRGRLPGADAERQRCACLHCTHGLAGRGDGYQCGLDWGRFS